MRGHEKKTKMSFIQTTLKKSPVSFLLHSTHLPELMEGRSGGAATAGVRDTGAVSGSGVAATGGSSPASSGLNSSL